jgi:hypothetical protein
MPGQPTAPIGHQIIYATRRHWYEILPELSDCIWWSSIVSVGSACLSDIFGEPRALILALFALFPICHFLWEIVLWNTEWYYITVTSSGEAYIHKRSGLLSDSHSMDKAAEAMPVSVTVLLGRILGYTKVTMKSPRAVYLQGQLIPAMFLEAYHRVQIKSPRLRDDDNDRSLVIKNLDPWVRGGLLEMEEARAAASRIVRDVMR